MGGMVLLGAPVCPVALLLPLFVRLCSACLGGTYPGLDGARPDPSLILMEHHRDLLQLNTTQAVNSPFQSFKRTFAKFDVLQSRRSLQELSYLRHF